MVMYPGLGFLSMTLHFPKSNQFFYDTSLPTTLQVDASKSGLGACLMQQGQPVACASRALSNSEINYAPIEKEKLAIGFGCERFNMYTHGAEVEVNSDHKPLENIF